MNIILPNQQPSREIMKAAAEFLGAVISQYPQMAGGIKDGFKVQVVNPLGLVLFSLDGDIQHARPFQGGFQK